MRLRIAWSNAALTATGMRRDQMPDLVEGSAPGGELRDTLRPGGQLVLETIYVPGDESYACNSGDAWPKCWPVA